MVEQLEMQQSDEDETIPCGDELASEIERYLRGQEGGTRPANPAVTRGSIAECCLVRAC